MNKVDVFAPEYIALVTSEPLFGIQDGCPAYIVVNGNLDKWNAVVDNSKKYDLKFVPLDHNIVINPTPETTYSLCDCMLYHEERWIALVELKNQGKAWIEEAIAQLKSTIELIQENPRVATFPHREAYAANLRFPAFKSSKKSRMNQFRNDTRFRLIITNRIKAK